MRPGAPSAGGIGARLTGLVSARPGAASRIDARYVRVAEYLLAAAIGAVLVTTLITLGSPVMTPSAAPRQSVATPGASIDGPVNPFRTAGGPVASLPADFNAGPDIAETTLNLVLHGTWLDADGGAAIIKTSDEKQSRFSQGDVIADGVTLERVYADRVIINRGGVRESLRLINRENRVASGAPADAQAGSGSDPDGLAPIAIGSLIVAEPRIDDIGVTRLALMPAGDKKAFKALGLRDGDLLVAIDNRSVAEDFDEGIGAVAALAGRASVTISVERDGAIVPIELKLTDTANERASDE